MFMDGSFCENPFMGLSVVTITGEEFFFDFLIAEDFTTDFDIAQSSQLDFYIQQGLLFSHDVGITNNFDFNIDKIENSDFLR